MPVETNTAPIATALASGDFLLGVKTGTPNALQRFPRSSLGTAVGLSLLAATDQAAARAAILAARTDAANTFNGDQLIQTAGSPTLTLTETGGSTLSLIAGVARSLIGMASASHGINLQSNGGPLGIGGSSTPSQQLEVTVRSSGRTGVLVKGASGQVEPLLELQDSLGAERFSITPVGSLQFRNSGGTSTGTLTSDYAGQGGVGLFSAGRLDLQGQPTYMLAWGATVGTTRQTYVNSQGGFNLTLNMAWRTGVLEFLAGNDGPGGGAFAGSYTALTAGSPTATTAGLTLVGAPSQTAPVISILDSSPAERFAISLNGSTAIDLTNPANGTIFLKTNSQTWYFQNDGSAIFPGALLVAGVTYSDTVKACLGTRLSYLDLNGGAKFVCTGATDVGLKINLASGQTANALEIKDSLGAVGLGFKVTAGSVLVSTPYETAFDFRGGGAVCHVYMRDLTLDSHLNFGDYQTSITASTQVGVVYLRNLVAGSSGGGTIQSTPKTVTQITADQNDYALNAGQRFYRLSSDASRTITGLAANRTDGIEFEFWNVGSFDIVLAHEDAGSAAANRFTCVTGASITLAPNEIACLRYDDTTDRFRVFKG